MGAEGGTKGEGDGKGDGDNPPSEVIERARARKAIPPQSYLFSPATPPPT